MLYALLYIVFHGFREWFWYSVQQYLVLVCHVIIFTVYFAYEMDTHIHLPATVLEGSCAINPDRRTDCGYPGVSQELCEERGCCFDSSIRGVIWCFDKNYTKGNYDYYYDPEVWLTYFNVLGTFNSTPQIWCFAIETEVFLFEFIKTYWWFKDGELCPPYWYVVPCITCHSCCCFFNPCVVVIRKHYWILFSPVMSKT